MATNNPTPFIEPDSARQAYEESYNWFRTTYFQPIDEFERLARNKPSPKIAPELPKITSGDLATIIQEEPKRTIQQLATGLVTSTDYPEYAPIADVVHRSRLLPMYNRMGTALQKHWSMRSQAKTYGRSCSYTFFTSTSGRLHTDFNIPYVKDILTEKGKVYAPDSNVAFMRTWYQKRDLQAILNKEQALLEKDKNYKSGWDLKLLAQFINEGGSAKPADQQTPAEREKGDGYSGGYEVIHAFQKGVGALQYAFAPRFKDGANLRNKVSKDPRGLLPLDFEYDNVDLSNPLGRGAVEISGGIQNLIDHQLQLYMYMSTYMQQPALQVWGGVVKSTLKYRTNALWDMGNNPANKVERDQVDNVFINNFVQNMQFLQSKLYALNGSSDNSIPGSVGGVEQSKTSQGVKANQVRLGVADNYAEKQHEAWFQAQAETSLNIFFNEMTGSETIDIGKQDVKSLLGTPAEKFVNASKDKLTIPYKNIADVVFKFKVDAGSSKAEDDADQLTKLKEVQDEYNANPLVVGWMLGQDGKKLNNGELMRQRFERMQIKNLDLVLTDMSPEEAKAAQQAPFPIADMPQIRLNSADLSPDAINAALRAGGVMIDPQQPPADPIRSASAQAQLDYQVEMAKAQALSAKDAADASLKETQAHNDTVLKADKQAHDTTLAVASHVQGAQQAQQSHELAQQQADTAAQAQNSGGSAEQPAEEASETPQQDASEPQAEQISEIEQVDGPLSDQEVQLVTELLAQGMTEEEVEQYIQQQRMGVTA